MRDHNVLELEPSTGLLARGYLRLGVYAMQAAGPSARTLAALYELADRRTRGMRVSIARIGALCGLPRRTVQRHLQRLEDDFGAIESRQTQGASRYRIDEIVWNARTRFVAMPKWWTCLREELQGWSTTATYAWLLSRSCLVERLEEGRGCLSDRMYVTRQEIAQTTGLTRRSVSVALEVLSAFRLIQTDAFSQPDAMFEFELQTVRLSR